MGRFTVASFLFCCLSFLSGVAQADQFELAECDGTVRFIQEIEAGRSHNLKVVLTEELEGQAILKSTSRSKTAVADEQQLLFEGVAADKWRLCSSEGGNISFKNVELVRVQTGSYSKAVLGAAGAGGVTLAALGISGAFSSDSGESRSGIGEMIIISDEPVAGANDQPQAGAPAFNPDDYPIGAPGAPLSPYR